MTVIIAACIAAIVGLGILTSVTDVRFHKARNRHLLLFAAIGAALQITAVIMSHDLMIPLLENLLLAAAISVAFYAAKIWAAGDAKLYFVMILLYPYDYFSRGTMTNFPALFVLGTAFSAALLFVFVESLVLFIRDLCHHKAPYGIRLRSFVSKDSFCSWIMALLAIDLADAVLKQLVSEMFLQTPYLMPVIHLLIANLIFSLIRTNRGRLISSAILLAVRTLITVMHLVPTPQLSVWIILIPPILLLLRLLTSQYNYRAIKTESVAEGQVLAQSTIALFLMSKGEGLPTFSDESTRCRLSADEAAAIRDWARSKGGKASVLVVRNIPFAPFIFAGVMLSLLACLCLRS